MKNFTPVGLTTISCLLLVLLAILLAGCSKRELTVTFPLENCRAKQTTETRERRIQTTCAYRQGGNVANPAKICMMWNHKTITERRSILTCSREDWVRE